MVSPHQTLGKEDMYPATYRIYELYLLPRWFRPQTKDIVHNIHNNFLKFYLYYILESYICQSYIPYPLCKILKKMFKSPILQVFTHHELISNKKCYEKLVLKFDVTKPVESILKIKTTK